MGIKTFATFALLAIGSSALPQTASETGSASASTDVSPSQSSEFKSALSSYYQSLRHSPEFSNIAIALALAPNGNSVISALEANPSTLLPITGTSVDLRSLATDPPLTFPTLGVYSGLGSDLVSSIQSLQTSAALEIAKLDQSVLSTTASLPTSVLAASSSSSSGGAGAAMAKPTGVMAMGAAVGALGAAVALL